MVPSSSMAFSEFIMPMLVGSARCADSRGYGTARRPYQTRVSFYLRKLEKLRLPS